MCRQLMNDSLDKDMQKAKLNPDGLDEDELSSSLLQ